MTDETRIDKMTIEEMQRAEQTACDEIAAAAHRIQAANNTIRDIHRERFIRELTKRRRDRKPDRP